MRNYTVQTKDRIVQEVIEELDNRSVVGTEKYGTTLEENNDDDYLQHLKEELLDAVLYIQKLQDMKDTLDNKLASFLEFAKQSKDE